MSESKIRFGMVGGGTGAFIGGVHRTAASFDPRAQFCAGCFSHDADKSASSGRQFGLSPERVYNDYAEMARAESSRDDGIDFVAITTPNVSHFAISKAFVTAGINVLCEKPLCFTVAESKELARLAEEHHVLFGLAYAYAGYPIIKLARELTLSGKLGKIINVHAQYPQEWLIDEAAGACSTTAKLSGWRDDPAVAGCSNCTGDIGSHIEYLVAYMTGLHIARVAAVTDNFGQPLDLNANILVEYDNGAHGNYWCSQIAVGHLNDLQARIYGTLGSLEWRQEEPEFLRVCMRGEPPQRFYRGAGYVGGRAAKVTRIPSGHVEGFYEAFANMYREFIDAVSAKKSGLACNADYPDIYDGIRGVQFINSVIQSGKSNASWVTLA